MQVNPINNNYQNNNPNFKAGKIIIKNPEKMPKAFLSNIANDKSQSYQRFASFLGERGTDLLIKFKEGFLCIKPKIKLYEFDETTNKTKYLTSVKKDSTTGELEGFSAIFRALDLGIIKMVKRESAFSSSIKDKKNTEYPSIDESMKLIEEYNNSIEKNK